MKKLHFGKTALALLVFNTLFIFIGTLLKVGQYAMYGNTMLTIGVLLYAILAVLMCIDILKQRNAGAGLWIASLLILPGIAPLMYCLQRNRHAGK